MSRHAELALTPDLVALVDRIEDDPGPDPGTHEPTPGELGALADRLLEELQGKELRVFAYGSLIWRPSFRHTTRVRGQVTGWHRSFCLRLTRWRGTPQLPGLMLSLDRGGSCRGVVYQLPRRGLKAQLVDLLQRELDDVPCTNIPRWLRVETDTGPVRALGFVAARDGRAYAGGLPHRKVAATLARAAGNWGSCADYLLKTVTELERHGIRDRNLWSLQYLVAREIQRAQCQR